MQTDVRQNESAFIGSRALGSGQLMGSGAGSDASREYAALLAADRAAAQARRQQRRAVLEEEMYAAEGLVAAGAGAGEAREADVGAAERGPLVSGVMAAGAFERRIVPCAGVQAGREVPRRVAVRSAGAAAGAGAAESAAPASSGGRMVRVQVPIRRTAESVPPVQPQAHGAPLEAPGGAGARAVLTVEQVAELLQVSRKCVYHWIAAGKLQSFNLGERQTRVAPEDLDRFLAARQVEGRRAAFGRRPGVGCTIVPPKRRV